jgi:hypothetical protein
VPAPFCVARSSDGESGVANDSPTVAEARSDQTVEPEVAMRTLIKMEELFLFFLSIFLFAQLEISWWWYPLVFLAPDLGILGYLAGPRFGAVSYNLLHHKAVAVTAIILGGYLASPILQLVGVIILGHSSLDRVLGYGLKYPDSFRHTHLGWIGRPAASDGGPQPVGQ